MSNLLNSILQMPVPFNMIVMIVLIGSVAGVITSIAREIRKYVCHREDLELKRDMLGRGMEADEIEQVMRASTGRRHERAE